MAVSYCQDLKMHLSAGLMISVAIALQYCSAQQFEIDPLWNNSATSCDVEVQNSSEKLVIFQGSPHEECSLRVQSTTPLGLVVAVGE